MAIRIDGDRLAVKSFYAWVNWIFFGTFLVAFPPAIFAMWQAGPEKIPLWANLIFTGLFAVVAPFLLKEFFGAHLVHARLDRALGTIEIDKRWLFSSQTVRRTFSDIHRLEMRTTDNNGEFFSLHVVFRDGSDFAFRHGNHRPYVAEECARFLAFLQKRLPDIKSVEKMLLD